MAYSTSLLSQFSMASGFKEDRDARQVTDFYFKEGNRVDTYPIIPLGTYYADQTRKSRQLGIYFTGIIFAVGLCLFLHGLVRSSPTSLTIGLLSLPFSIRKIVESLVMVTIYPSVLTGLRRKHPSLYGRIIPELEFGYLSQRQRGHALVTGLYDDNEVSGLHVTNISLIKNGVSYDAYFIQKHEKTTAWVIHALEGNDFPGHSINDLPMDYFVLMQDHYKFNHVIVSPPSVGHSGGWPNTENIGDGFLAALQLIEQIKPTHIIMEARGNFGGFTVAKAIEKHPFLNQIKYLYLSISSASSLAKAMEHSGFGRLGKTIVQLAGMRFSSKKALEKLEKLQIKRLVVGHEDPSSPYDGPVHDEANLLKN